MFGHVGVFGFSERQRRNEEQIAADQRQVAASANQIRRDVFEGVYSGVVTDGPRIREWARERKKRNQALHEEQIDRRHRMGQRQIARGRRIK